ncbi:tail tape measure protein [Altererythrobacter sp. B11]|uniref:tail tape measure protein n=1 Tax=Altererythrobacter sp. B11 TaxID=2060312 RepID=UPI000DC6F498|nr:tail tape measure protein [Altererythrobacter sp. B11]BBC71594.1 tail tape measure protein [Altererythrobacter sp. B11]
MDDEIETLLVDVRATTDGFRADMETMRGALDSTLVDGFARAGNVLESGLLSAIRRGGLGFDELKRTAIQTMDQIAAEALKAGLGGLFSPTGGGGAGAVLSGALGALLGLPGRATGGPVSPGSAYVVGERGPELFVPTSAGRVEAPAARGRDVQVSIRLAAPKGTAAPAALQRSARQVASSVRRALRDF